MNPIRVNKATLMEVLITNRDEHREIFEKAQERYRERFIEELDRRLQDARAGRQIDQYIALPVPEDHTEDYVRVIQMLELSLDDEIMLTEADARMYVQNQWSWAASFTANSTSYLVT